MRADARSSVLLALVGVLATAAARKAVDVVWVASTGTRAPRADDPDVAPKRAVSAAARHRSSHGRGSDGVARKRHEIKRRKTTAE